jgi:hypothetical protein
VPIGPEHRETLAHAAREGHPVWVLLAARGGWPNWYEPAREIDEVWADFGRPRVSWSEAQDVLDLLGISPEGSSDKLMAQVLDLLPFVYDLGATRAFEELSAEDRSSGRARLFPTCGFVTSPGAERPESMASLEPLRLSVGIVDNLVLTLPHPKLGRRRSLDGRPVSGPGPSPEQGLRVPVRYLPSARAVDARDVADGVALHLGVTCEWVVQLGEEELAEIERSFFTADGEPDSERGTGADSRSNGVEAPFERLNELGDRLRQVERELAAILQRSPPSGRQNGQRLEPTYQVEARYRASLEKVRSLQSQVRLAGETMASTMMAKQLALAERQQAESDRLQRAGTILAAFVLIPGLIAAVYGANLRLPGANPDRAPRPRSEGQSPPGSPLGG